MLFKTFADGSQTSYTTYQPAALSSSGTTQVTDLLFAGMSASSLQLQWYPGNSIHLDGIQIVNTSPNLLPAATPLSIAANSTFDLNGESQQWPYVVELQCGEHRQPDQQQYDRSVALDPGCQRRCNSFSGLIAGGGTLGTVNLVISGSGTQILAGANTYTGATTISSGTLQLGTGASGQDGSIANTSGVTNNSALVYNLYGNQTAAYAIGGSGSLTKTGGGLLALTASNTYAGGTTINGGTLNINSDANLGGVNSGMVFTNNATLQQAGTASVSLGSGRGISINNNVTATIDTQANAMSIAGVISGSGGLTKVGSGTLSLAAANTFSGPTAITGGTLNVAHPLALQNSTVTVNANNSLAIGSGLNSATLGGLSGYGNLALNNAALTVGGNGASTTYSGLLSGGSGLTKTGSGQMSLVGQQAYNGPTIVSAGTLQLNPGSEIGIKFTTNRTGGVYAVTGQAGQVPMANWNNLTGQNQATPQALSNNFNASTLATVSWSGCNDNYDVFNASQTDQNAQLLNSYMDNTSGGGLETVTVTGVPYSNYNVYVYLASDGNGRNGAVTIGGTTYYYQTNANLATRPYPLTQTTSTTSANYMAANYALFTGLTGGTLVISQTESFNNGIAAVEVVGNNVNNTLPATTPVTIAAGATLDLGGVSQQIVSLSDASLGGGGSLINSAASMPATLTLSPTGGTSVFSGQIGGGPGAISLVVNGAGAQVLAGSNSYAGGTAMNNGMLVVADGPNTSSAFSALGTGVLTLTAARWLPARRAARSPAWCRPARRRTPSPRGPVWPPDTAR